MRRCPRCKTTQPICEFSKAHPYCKGCKRIVRRAYLDRLKHRPAEYAAYKKYKKDWAERNKEKIKALNRASWVEREYGISRNDPILQAKSCAICGKSGKLDVDHCHDTGRVRGMLCRQCNLGIGVLRDDPDMIAKAVAYLLSSKYPDLQLIA